MLRKENNVDWDVVAYFYMIYYLFIFYLDFLRFIQIIHYLLIFFDAPTEPNKNNIKNLSVLEKQLSKQKANKKSLKTYL